MNAEKEISVETLLADYYQCPEPEALHLEAVILEQAQPRLRRWLNKETALTDAEDAYAEVRMRLLNVLRRGRQTGEPKIEFFWGYAKTTVTRMVIDAKRRDDPRYFLRLRLRYLTMNKRFTYLFARWNLAQEELIGLAAWIGQAFVNTEAYQAFVRDDTRFVQTALQGRSPTVEKQVPLPELLMRFLQWIETPLQESPLVQHLIALTAPQMLQTVSVDALAVVMERSADDILPPAPQPRESDLDWEACWLMIARLPMKGRRALLLGWSREMLMTAARRLDIPACLSEALEYPADAAARLSQRLPMDDTEIAAQIGMTVNHVQVARHRALKALQNGLKGRM